jgi:YjbE family integral membrane protein
MPDWVVPLAQVLFIDLVLAGDNAIVVGMAAAGLPAEQKRKAIFWGIVAATIMRIAFSAVTVQLLAIPGLLVVGGLMLLWVCWKMFQDLRGQKEGHGHGHAVADVPVGPDGQPQTKTMRAAITQILIADITMSLDNVLAVAGASKGVMWVLVVGLIVSVALMGVAATWIAKLLEKYKWLGWVGLAIILYVSLDMIRQGWPDIQKLLG